MLPLPPRSTLFPYTTLFRSLRALNFWLKDGRANQPVHGNGRLNLGAQEKQVKLPCAPRRSEEHTSELQSPYDLVCRLLLEKKKKTNKQQIIHNNTKKYSATA